MNKKNILNDDDIELFRKDEKLQPFRIKQIYQEIFRNSNINFLEMTTLSKDLRETLNNRFFIVPFEIEKIVEWIETTKFLLKTYDGESIESVIMFHSHEKESWEVKLNRLTLCISTQVWCPVWCIFCVTWKLGLKRNLSYEEIIWQLLIANNYIKNKLWKKQDWELHKIRNIVFMWMWEPLLNYDNLIKSIETMNNQIKWFSLSRKHITISTSGIVTWIKRLINDNIQIMLAISLHAPNQTLRKELIPIWQRYDIKELIAILDEYYKKSKNRIFYEYIMIEWLTDYIKLAEQLNSLTRHQDCHINLIPYNENPAMPDLKESSRNRIYKFKEKLESLWSTVTIRWSLWRNEKWACWQLWYEKLTSKNI